MEVYKKHLIEALEEETLSWGQWCSPNGMWMHAPAKNTDCIVCAVGGTFRRFSNRSPYSILETVENMTENDRVSPYINHYNNHPPTLPKSWLAAVSWVWESLMPDGYNSNDRDDYLNNIEQARWHMIDWVEENVPSDIVLWKA